MLNIQQPQKLEQQKQPELILTKQQKTRILTSILKDINAIKIKKMPLEVSISYDTIKKQNKNTTGQQTLFQYNIPGSKFRQRSKLSNLVGKIQDMEKMGSEMQAEKETGKDGDQSGESQNAQQEQVANNTKNEDNWRYYKDNVLCFRCNKVGHFRQVCPEISTCLYCFSQNHQAENCPQKKVCFKCYGFGHIIANCTSKQNQSKCSLCQKYHDGGCYFLINKIKDPTKKKQFYENIYMDQNIQCPRCYQYGHIDCTED